MNNDKPQTQIYIQTKQSPFGKKSIVFSKGSDRKNNNILFWIIITIVMGVSVPYFLVDAGTKAYQKVAVYFGIELSQADSTNTLDTTNKSYGSDDADNVMPIKGQGVFVNPEIEGQYYFLGPDYKIPRTSGLAYQVADVETGEIIIEKNPEMVLPIASISKLITALVAQQYMNLRNPVTVTRSSVAMYGTYGGLSNGEKILGNDLLYPLLIESSNDAAEVFAESYGYDEFIKHMNEKAQELGMMDTSFFEPSGLSPKNISTVGDLMKLVKYVTKNDPELWDITRIRQYAILRHSWVNGNNLSRKTSFLGGKNGYTVEANRTTASYFIVPVEGGVRKVAITLLKSNDRDGDVDALLRFVSKWVGFLPAGHQLNEDN